MNPPKFGKAYFQYIMTMNASALNSMALNIQISPAAANFNQQQEYSDYDEEQNEVGSASASVISSASASI